MTIRLTTFVGLIFVSGLSGLSQLSRLLKIIFRIYAM